MSNEDKVLVSIIIPSYNREAVIGDTLLSVLNQLHKNWECIVVDDGSNDNTLAVVKSFINQDSRIKFFTRPKNKNKGANACRNYGLKKSKGDYINWLDSDDVLAEDHISKHINCHKQMNIQASVSLVNTFHESTSHLLGLWANPFPDTDVIDDMCRGKVSWQTASIIWRREVLPEVSFNEDLQSAQEWTFHIEQMIRRITFKVFNETTVYVRRHEERTGKDFSPKKYRSMFMSRYLIFKTLYSSGKLSTLREKGLLKRMAQASKGAARARYYTTSFIHWRTWIVLLFYSQLTIKILGILLFGIPLYLILGKGERFFKF